MLRILMGDLGAPWLNASIFRSLTRPRIYTDFLRFHVTVIPKYVGTTAAHANWRGGLRN